MKNQYRLALYSNEGGSEEFVVILSEGADATEHESGDVILDQIVEIEGDFITWPTDRPLEK